MLRSRHRATSGAVRLLLAIWIVITALPMRAQLSTATINGTVHDASGAAVPQADIVLRNVETGVETRTQSNAAGVYAILNILPAVTPCRQLHPDSAQRRYRRFAWP